MSLVDTLYTPKVAAARERVLTDSRMSRVLDPSRDPIFFERFLIQFSVSGYHMTEPVEGWIRRAGERCIALGYREIGDLLVSHAGHEAGHQTMMLEDAKLLVGRWNERRPASLSVDTLFAAPPVPATKRYIAIHEDTIAGPIPFAQTSIELEIEQMSPKLGPVIVERAKALFGDDIGLSFIKEHALLDVGHTNYNTSLMEKCLAVRPDAAEAVAKIGSEALNIYMDFLGECVEEAERALGGS